MPLIDDPAAWILKLFRMEERERGGEHCRRFEKGTRDPWSAARPPLWRRWLHGLGQEAVTPPPLDHDELVYGVFRDRYIFTQRSFIVRTGQGFVKLPWKDITSGAPVHGTDGRIFAITTRHGIRVELRREDLWTGSSGRIGQLLIQLMDRHGDLEHPTMILCTVEEFMASNPSDHDLLPNVDPRPSVTDLHDSLISLQRTTGVHAIRLELAEDEPRPTVLSVLVRAGEEALPAMEAFGERFGADGVVRLERSEGRSPEEHHWHIRWD